ncbi:hypothetical protein FQN54_000954 [Arachnomyces sp. PD_36]|nr:hypothetical protein FQN54_000954 [Arachnomyces sp. PD_36]
MDCEQRSEIERILKAVRSICDLNREAICDLQETFAGRVVIDKFKVKPSEWKRWKDQWGEVHGIEYDAQKQLVVTKPRPTGLHDAVNAAMRKWLDMVARILRAATESKFRHLQNLGLDLAGKQAGTFLEADHCIHRTIKKYPLVLVEVGVSESTPQIFRDTEKWLEGSNGQTRLAIVIDINQHLPKEQKQKPMTSWGLSDSQIVNFTLGELTQHILRWNSSNLTSFMGEFNACVYLRFQGQEWRAIWEYEFPSQGPFRKPLVHDKTYTSITTKDLLPELDFSVELPLPLEELANEMEDSLPLYRAQRAEVQANIKMKGILSKYVKG